MNVNEIIWQSSRCGFQPHGHDLPLMFLEDRAVGNRTYDFRNISSIINQPHGLHLPLMFLEDRAVGNRTYDYRNIFSIINQPHGLHLPLVFLEDRAVGNRTYDFRNISSIINLSTIRLTRDVTLVAVTYETHNPVTSSV